jgi:hypothetical protein
MYGEAEEELLARRVIGDNTTFKLLFNALSISEVDHLQFLDYNILDCHFTFSSFRTMKVAEH